MLEGSTMTVLDVLLLCVALFIVGPFIVFVLPLATMLGLGILHDRIALWWQTRKVRK